MKKRGQQTTEMPFGIIFAVFLIVIFLIIAFNATKGFIKQGECTSINLFYQEFQEQVDDLWAAQSGDKTFEINLPSGIKEICFANLTEKITNPGEEYNSIKIDELEGANLFLIPPNKACGKSYQTIKHINISKTISKENPYCIELPASIKLKKETYVKYVLIE